MLKINSTFLDTADESIITKAELYEFTSVVAYIGFYPKIYNFPILLIVSLILIAYFIKFSTFFVFLLFIVLTSLLYWVTWMHNNSKLDYEFEAC